MNHLLSPNKVIAGAKYELPEVATISSADSQLHVLIAPSQLVYLVANSHTKRVVLLQPYQFSRITSVTEWHQSIDTVFESDPWLQKEVAIKRTGVFSPNFTLVPAAYDSVHSRRTILKANCTVDEEQEVYADSIAGGDIQLLFAFAPEIVQRCSGKSNSSVSHSLSGLINQLLALNQTNETENLYVYVQASSFQLILVRDRKLHFCNSFNYQSPEDFLYHLLFACTQLRLDPELVPLTIMGEVMRESALYQLLIKYIRHVEFARPFDGLRFNSDYPLPAHFFFNLFCL